MDRRRLTYFYSRILKHVGSPIYVGVGAAAVDWRCSNGNRYQGTIKVVGLTVGLAQERAAYLIICSEDALGCIDSDHETGHNEEILADRTSRFIDYRASTHRTVYSRISIGVERVDIMRGLDIRIGSGLS